MSLGTWIVLCLRKDVKVKLMGLAGRLWINNFPRVVGSLPIEYQLMPWQLGCCQGLLRSSGSALNWVRVVAIKLFLGYALYQNLFAATCFQLSLINAIL